VVITVCLAGNPNVRQSFIDLKYGLSFETCKQQFYMAAHSNVNLDKYALEDSQSHHLMLFLVFFIVFINNHNH